MSTKRTFVWSRWPERRWFPALRVGLVLGMFALAALAFLYAEQGLVESTACREAVARLQGDPQAVALLGTPIQIARPVVGTLTEEDGEQTADFTIPVRGPKARGRLKVHGRRAGQLWRYGQAILTVNGTDVEVLGTTVQ